MNQVGLYGDTHIYPDWPRAAVGVAMIPTWAAEGLARGQAWSPPSGWPGTAFSGIETAVGAVLRNRTRHAHPDRGLVLVAHRLLVTVDVCDMPQAHDASCPDLHCPPGWSAVVVRVPPDRMAFITPAAAAGVNGSDIEDRDTHPLLGLPGAAYFVVDHLRAEDVSALAHGPSWDSAGATAAWWARWAPPKLATHATQDRPLDAGHLVGPDAVPAVDGFPWPSRTRLLKAARSLRRFVQDEDAWWDTDRPFPNSDPPALVAASVAWALRSALDYAAFPADLPGLLTEADLGGPYDFGAVAPVIGEAAATLDYSAAVERAWADPDPVRIATQITAFANGLALGAAESDDCSGAAVTKEWADEVYDLDALQFMLRWRSEPEVVPFTFEPEDYARYASDIGPEEIEAAIAHLDHWGLHRQGLPSPTDRSTDRLILHGLALSAAGPAAKGLVVLARGRFFDTNLACCELAPMERLRGGEFAACSLLVRTEAGWACPGGDEAFARSLEMLAGYGGHLIVFDLRPDGQPGVTLGQWSVADGVVTDL